MKKKIINVMLTEKFWDIYGTPILSDENIEVYSDIIASRDCTCYGCNHIISSGVKVNRIITTTKRNGGITFCTDCYNKMFSSMRTEKTLCEIDEEESKNTGHNVIIIVTENPCDVIYLKLYGFYLFNNKFYSQTDQINHKGITYKGKYILVKIANKGTQTMRNLKPFYKEGVNIYVNHIEVNSYEEARKAVSMKIKETLKENLKK